MSEKRTMTLNLSDREMDALEALCNKQDLSKTALLRQALRLYQLVNTHVTQGDRILVERAEGERVELVLLGTFSLPMRPPHA